MGGSFGLAFGERAGITSIAMAAIRWPLSDGRYPMARPRLAAALT